MLYAPLWLAGFVAASAMVAELVLTTRRGWGVRNWLAGLVVASLILSSVIFLFTRLEVIAGLVFLVSMYRLVNVLRAVQNRWNPIYLRLAVKRTGLVLMLVQSLLLMVDWVWYRGDVWPLRGHTVLVGLGLLQCVAGVIAIMSTVRTLIKSAPRAPKGKHRYFSDSELPTVSVCIPARDETRELEECIRAVIANPYPKLEVLVLDDCSQDRTPDIIKSFAHDGVRFFPGEAPRDGWLAKNQACDALLDQASGDVVIFCGVDVRFAPDTIRSIVETMMRRKKDMVSIMPRRMSGGWSAAFIQPMRYWWELALPRHTFNRPPVLSTVWAIRKTVATRLGAFESVKGAIIPEAVFARELVKTDHYSFLRSNDFLKVYTLKNVAEQRATAIRMRYPQVRKRPEMVLLITAAEVVLLLGPFVMLLLSLWWFPGTVVFGLNLAASVLIIATHVAIVAATNPANTPLALLNLPIAVAVEIVLGNLSMYKYEFSTVDWKGRNVCLPVLQAIPRLPELK